MCRIIDTTTVPASTGDQPSQSMHINISSFKHVPFSTSTLWLDDTQERQVACKKTSAMLLIPKAVLLEELQEENRGQTS